MKRGGLAIAGLFAAGLGAAAFALPSGHKWSLQTNPSPTYRVYDHGGTGRPVKGISSWPTALAAVQASFARWTKAQVSCTSWTSTAGSAFTSPAGRAAINGTDGNSLVLFLGGTDPAWTWTHDPLTLAVTTTTYFNDTGIIFDADMELNNDIPNGWKAGGQGNQSVGYDLESVVTHEAGHFLGLSHTPSATAVMGPSFGPGEVRKVLTQSDLNDLCGVYPGTPGTGSTLGTPCTGDPGCSGTYPVCRARLGGSASAMTCTRECTIEDCPAGTTCLASSPAGGSGKACLVPLGSADLCAFCTNDQECSTGICAYDDQTGRRWCTATCQTPADCGAGYACVATPAPFKVCQPQNANGNSCNRVDIPNFAGQCTSAAQCAPGYGCDANGACQIIGTLGARCELTNVCAACYVCTGSVNEAYCRPCCAGTGNGGRCSACPPVTCSGSTCTALTTGLDGVCVPPGSLSCQACGASQPCADGMQCIAGRCHSACNPDHPGRCAACFATGNPGEGLCACSDQIVSIGASCGTQPNGDFRACQPGAYCAGSPKTCLAVCNLGDNSTCSPGQTCSIIDGKALCSGGAIAAGQQCGVSVGACGGNSCAPGLSCHGNRCYQSCDPGTCAPDYGCVRVSPFLSVCVCSDQRSTVGGPCGSYNGSVYSCTNGLVCANSVCRVACDSSNPCPAGRTCDQVAGGSFCSLPPNPDGGSSELAGGCGCEGGGWAGVVPVFLVLVALARQSDRRRSSRA